MCWLTYFASTGQSNRFAHLTGCGRMRKSHVVTFCLGFVLSVQAVWVRAAEDSVGRQQSRTPADAEVVLVSRDAPRPIWKHQFGHGFAEDTFRAGISAGGGFGHKAFGGQLEHDLALASLNFGWMFDEVGPEGTWYQGNWEPVAELFAGGKFNPKVAHVVGVTVGIRYNFSTGTAWVPFIDGGVGLSGTEVDKPDLSTAFEFNVQAGIGTHWFWTETTALTLQYRLFHLSNAGIQEPNLGLNTSMFLLGLNWFF